MLKNRIGSLQTPSTPCLINAAPGVSGAAYRRELEQMAALGDWATNWKDKVSATVLLGSDSFVRQMVKRLKGNRHEQLGLRQSERVGPDWEAICTAVSAVWKKDWDTLVAARGNGALPAAWYLARNFAGMRLVELGLAAGDAAYSAVSMAISRFERRLEVDRDLQRRLKAVRKVLQLLKAFNLSVTTLKV